MFTCPPPKKYLKSALAYDVASGGLVAVLPYLAKFAIQIGAGWAADRLIARRCSVRAARVGMQVGR